MTGWLYATGKSVALDPATALALFRQGATQDNILCEWGMGMLSENGAPGLPQNHVEADVFLKLAVRNKQSDPDFEQVRRVIAAIEAKLDEREKATVQHLLDDALSPTGTQ